MDISYYKQFAVMGRTLTEDVWVQIRDKVFEMHPTFHAFMDAHDKELNDKEFKTCALIRAGFKPRAISNMLGVGPSYISNIRAEMLRTLFHREGGVRQFDEALKDID